MRANTKLDRNQKDILKAFKNDFPEIQILNVDNKTTMAFINRGNTIEFALSVMAPTEKKFRPKVGEYFAYNRFLDGHTVKMGRIDFEVMCECVWGAYMR